MGYQSDEEKGPQVAEPQGSKMDYQDRIQINTAGKNPRGIIEYLAIFFSLVLTILFFPITICSSYKTIRQYDQMSII